MGEKGNDPASAVGRLVGATEPAPSSGAAGAAVADVGGESLTNIGDAAKPGSAALGAAGLGAAAIRRKRDQGDDGDDPGPPGSEEQGTA